MACFKGFDAASFAFNTMAKAERDQLSLLDPSPLIAGVVALQTPQVTSHRKNAAQ
jgi:hypothetical protein